MSSVVISGDTSGTVSLTVPAVAGTNTATLPAATGTVMVSGNMPAFSAYQGTNQTVSNGVFTKLAANIKEFDTANCYDAAINYRFTPNVAGYYQINGQIFCNASTAITGNSLVSIFKNGSRFKDGNLTSGTLGSAGFYVVSALIYMNGSTDYVELYGLISGTGTLTMQHDASTSYSSYFQGCLMRAA